MCMLPYLNIFSRRIPTYGIAAAVGILLGYWYLRRRTRALPLRDQAELELAYLFGMVGTFVGAKLLSLLTQLPQLLQDLRAPAFTASMLIEKYLSGGFVFYGGLYGALLGLIYMALGVGLYALLSGQQLPLTAYLSDIAMGVAGGGIAGAIVGGMRKR